MLDIRGLASFADYFVICSADSPRQIDSICDEVEKALDDSGTSVRHREGTPESGWVLMDYGDVIVHVFSPAERDYYQLDRVWDKAGRLLRVQ